MKERIREIAGELIAVAAERALRPGEVAEPDAQGYATFVDRFPFAETDDQDRAIADVLADLGAGRPMDRLIVGDVGFGKTERSEERRVGTEWVSTFRTRWSQYT